MLCRAQTRLCLRRGSRAVAVGFIGCLHARKSWRLGGLCLICIPYSGPSEMFSGPARAREISPKHDLSSSIFPPRRPILRTLTSRPVARWVIPHQPLQRRPDEARCRCRVEFSLSRHVFKRQMHTNAFALHVSESDNLRNVACERAKRFSARKLPLRKGLRSSTIKFK